MVIELTVCTKIQLNARCLRNQATVLRSTRDGPSASLRTDAFRSTSPDVMAMTITIRPRRNVARDAQAPMVRSLLDVVNYFQFLEYKSYI